MSFFQAIFINQAHIKLSRMTESVNSVQALIENNNKKRKVIERRSWAWDYFPFVANTKKFKCSVCGEEVEIYGSSTTELIRHLQDIHHYSSETRNALFAMGSINLDESSDEYSDNEQPIAPVVKFNS